MFRPRGRTILGSCLMAAQLGLISCDGDPAEHGGNGQAPDLPPAASMEVDLSLFDGASSTPDASAGSSSQAHFANAALRAAVIHTVTLAVMAVPAATFAAAASNDPVLGSDGKFHWLYGVQHGGHTFEADLTGFIDVPNAESVWEMYVTATGTNPPLNGFLWYNGRAALDNTHGDWHVYDHTVPGGGIEVLGVDWTHLTDEQVALEFTSLRPGAPEHGDRLTYRIDGNDRSITFLDASEGTTLEIWWNHATGEGYLIAPLYNGGQKACWDTMQSDAPCS
jgi:hypothetical protein